MFFFCDKFKLIKFIFNIENIYPCYKKYLLLKLVIDIDGFTLYII